MGGFVISGEQLSFAKCEPMGTARKVTVRLKHGKRGFWFVEDGSVNRKSTSFYTFKKAAILGAARHMGTKPYRIVDETGVTHRGNPVKP